MESTFFEMGVDFTRDLMARVKELRSVGVRRRTEILETLADPLIDLLYDLSYCVDNDGVWVDLVHDDLRDDDVFELSEEDALTVILQMREVRKVENELEAQMELKPRVRGASVTVFEVVDVDVVESLFREAIRRDGCVDNADFISARMLIDLYDEWHEQLDEILPYVLLHTLNCASSLCERGLEPYDGRTLSRCEQSLQEEGAETLLRVNERLDGLLADHPELTQEGRRGCCDREGCGDEDDEAGD